MKEIKAILFDKDGTLIDFNQTWLPIYTQAAQYLAETAGQPHRAAELLAAGGYLAESNTWKPDSLLASGSNAQIYEHWQDVLDMEITGDIYKKCQSFFYLKEERYAPVLPDLTDFLEGLRSKGFILGVATMDDEASAISTLQGLGCLQCFDFICGADSGFGVKPDAGMINAFCDHCKVPVSSTAMVGDSPRDLTMGRNAGAALCVGVLTGTTSRDNLNVYADVVFENISGLASII